MSSNYPATTYADGVELTMKSGNQLHEIINGTATEEITTDSGMVPSVRKAIADSMLFKQAIEWAQGSVETDPLQTRNFNGTLFWAPAATTATPVAMGASPVSDSNWSLAPVGRDTVAMNTNLISNSHFEFAGTVTNPPDAVARNYDDGDEIFSGIYAKGAITNLTFVDGVLNGFGELYVDVVKNSKMKEATSGVVSSIAGANGEPYITGSSVADAGDYYRVTFSMNNTFSVKLEQGSVATGHSFPPLKSGLKTIFASDYVVDDWNGTTGTNNKLAFKHMQELLSQNDGMSLNLDCEFLVDIDSESDLVQVVEGVDRDYTLSLVEGVTSPTIYGKGKIHYRNSSGKRVWLTVFKDCERPLVTRCAIDGGFKPTETTTTTSSQHVVMFINCQQPRQSYTRIEKIDGAPNSVTGSPISPAPVANTGEGAIIEGNFFNYFEQCSTFGAGTESYWFKNNHCKNHWLSGLKVSSNIKSGTGDTLGKYKIVDNIHDWDDDFKTPLQTNGVDKCFPHAMQSEASGRLLDYRGNTIDMTKIQASQVNNKTTCIILSGSFEDDPDRWMKDVSITNNQMLGSQHNVGNNLMSISPAIYNLTVANNPVFSGNVGIGTSNSLNVRRGKYRFYGNGGDGAQSSGQPLVPTTFYVNKIVAETLQISGDFNGGNIVFTSLPDLINLELQDIKNAGRVKMNSSSDRLKAVNVEIFNSSAKSYQIYLTGATVKSFIANSFKCLSQTGIGLDIKTENNDADVQILSMSALGDGSSGLIPTAFSLDAGNLRVGDIGMNTNANTTFIITDNVTVRAGSLSKSGAPDFKAFAGVRYVDLSSGSYYIKTSFSGKDGWKKISTES
tara:strand:+ start:16283 stop:18805 length:2523 start_codon:yes stop_codon:yes gene_type:complete